jgi:hypothetical protein
MCESAESSTATEHRDEMRRRRWLAGGRAFLSPNGYAQKKVERWAVALRWVAGLNGIGIGLAPSYAMTAYSALDGSCEKRLLVSDAVISAARLGWLFAVVGGVALGFSLAPALIRGSIQWLRLFRGLSPISEVDVLTMAWGGVLVITAAMQRLVLLLALGLFCLGVVWALNFASSQTSDALTDLWRRFEQQCSAAPAAPS